MTARTCSGTMHGMSTVFETAARVDVLAATVRAIALALPADAAMSAVDRLQVELSNSPR